MTLYFIGIGLSNEKDITLKGLEAIKLCDTIYLENYTSLLQCSPADLEKSYGKRIIIVNRTTAEQEDEKIIKEAEKKNVAFLVIGDPFSATTHAELLRLALEKKVPVKVIHNASILTAIGMTGLQLYKFGKTTSIPFTEDYPNIETPYNVFRENCLLGSHTLFLLDINPEQKKFMTVNEALEILETIETRKKENVMKDNMLVVGCARLGADDFMIKAGALKDLKNIDFGKPPHCLIIPGQLHFIEKEMVKMWK